MRRPKHKLLSPAGYDPQSANAADGWWHQLEGFETEEKARAEDLLRLDLASMVGTVLVALADYSDDKLAVVTVLKPSWAFTPDQLMGETAAAIKNRFFTDLKRSGIAFLPGPLIAFLHGEYEPTNELFQLHWHLITIRSKANAFAGLVAKFKGYTKTHTGAVPVRVDQVKDRVRLDGERRCFRIRRSVGPETRRDRLASPGRSARTLD